MMHHAKNPIEQDENEPEDTASRMLPPFTQEEVDEMLDKMMTPEHGITELPEEEYEELRRRSGLDPDDPNWIPF